MLPETGATPFGTGAANKGRFIMRKLWSLSFIFAFAAFAGEAPWQSDFKVDKADLASSGRNPFFVLEVGHQIVLENSKDKERLVITVLNETKTVDGVETRIVEENETKDGKQVEISRNYFAISKRDQAVYYFGEDVDMYKDGKIVSHEGAWLSGVKGAKFGLMMPGQPALKAKYYQEVAPKVAMDRAEVVSLTETVKTPAGEFKNCVKTEETTPLEPGVKEYKVYVRDIGLVQDGDLKLVKRGKGGEGEVTVLLRDVTDADLLSFFEFQLDPIANRMAAFTHKDPTDRAAFDAHWSRVRSDDRVIIKSIVFEAHVVGHVAKYERCGQPEVTYWIAKEHWGKGIATAALSEFLRLVTVRPIYGGAAKDNVASLRVLEKCGFTVVGSDSGFANARGEEIEELFLKLEADAVDQTTGRGDEVRPGRSISDSGTEWES